MTLGRVNGVKQIYWTYCDLPPYSSQITVKIIFSRRYTPLFFSFSLLLYWTWFDLVLTLWTSLDSLTSPGLDRGGLDYSRSHHTGWMTGCHHPCYFALPSHHLSHVVHSTHRSALCPQHDQSLLPQRQVLISCCWYSMTNLWLINAGWSFSGPKERTKNQNPQWKSEIVLSVSVHKEHKSSDREVVFSKS